MAIAQRGTSFATHNDGDYSLDRWRVFVDSPAVVTVSQDNDVPTGYGFEYSLKVDVTTADATIGATDLNIVQYRFEGYDFAQLEYGDASARTVTLSFWVKSPKTGTHTVSLRNHVASRSYVTEYTVSVADTWEKKEITISGDTAGTWVKDNSIAAYLDFSMAVGSNSHGTADAWTGSNIISTANQVNVMDNTANNFYITGVQFEVGSSATDFERVPWDYQLRRCQRYYWFNQETNFGNPFAGGYSYNATAASIIWHHPVEMRAPPTFTLTLDSVTPAYFYDTAVGKAITSSSGTWANKLCSKGHLITSGLTAGNGGLLNGAGGANNKFEFSAEL
jgi:hypothetical protein